MKTLKQLFNSDFIKPLFILAINLLIAGICFSQNVGINNPTPHSKALMDLTSSDKGFLTPRMTLAEKNAMFPAPDATAKGMTIYQTDGLQGFYYYDGAAWIYDSNEKSGWNLNGNAGTNAANNFIGTTDSVSLLFRTNNTERMRVFPNGHVSVNSTYSPVQFYIRSNEAGNGVSGLQNMHNTGYVDEWFLGADGQLKGYIGYGNPGAPILPGLFYSGTNLNLAYALVSNNTERMRIAGNGNIGIGTTNPTARFHVATNSITGNPNIRITESGNDFTRIGMYNDSTANFYEVTASPNNVDTIAAYNVFYNTRGNLMTVKGDGRIGISNSNPAAPLSFNNNLGNKITLWGGFGSMYGVGIQNNLMQLFTANANSDIAFGHGSSQAFTENMRIMGNGNVGIGTSSPLTKLHISTNNILVPVRIHNQNASSFSGMHFVGSNGNLMGHMGYANTGAGAIANTVYIGSTAAVPAIITTSDVERVRVDATGNVGIGTTAPTAKMEINGFTKLGTDGPAVKTKKVTGTLGSTGNTSIAHGISNHDKILSAIIYVDNAFGNSVPPHYRAANGHEYDYYISPTSIVLTPITGNSAQVVNRPVRVLITYEE